MTTHEIFVRARNILVKRGWTRGYGIDKVCALHAIVIAETGYEKVQNPEVLKSAKAFRRINNIKDAFISDHFDSELYDHIHIASWNDTTSYDEVLAAFDKAIATTAPLPEDLDLEDVEESTETERNTEPLIQV